MTSPSARAAECRPDLPSDPLLDRKPMRRPGTGPDGRLFAGGAGGAARRLLGAVAAGLLVQAGALAAGPGARAVHHELRVALDPESHGLRVEDTITLPEGFLAGRAGDPVFSLHQGLEPALKTPGARLERIGEQAGKRLLGETAGSEGAAVKVEYFRVALPPGTGSFVVSYGGAISHPLEAQGEDYARGFRETPGTISPEGVFLSGSSAWYPRFRDDEFVSFLLEARVPGGWDVVSQGTRTLHDVEGTAGGTAGAKEPKSGPGVTSVTVRWESPEPQDEIYLVAARFTETERETAGVTAMAFLRAPDENLANKYLDATGRYLGMYAELLGPYPYRKFALVENFWETGYGMPSFTLLGPTVIRLPFIINSSYPHEILHNWWGNGVYVDYAGGNWCEGLTAYLSDHLIAEQQGTGAEYRQTTLQKYADYVSRSKDFPLTEFRERHSSSTEAIGYGKSLMVFNMLRSELGDKTFVQGLKEFYGSNRFRRASFEDLRGAFERASGRDLHGFFEQWVNRKGAPVLRASGAEAIRDGDGWTLGFSLSQGGQAGRSDQPPAGMPRNGARTRARNETGDETITAPRAAAAGAPGEEGRSYRVTVPVAVTLEGRREAWETTVLLEGPSQDVSLRLPARPLRVDVDPAFDLFRRLDRNEIPPALSQAFGAEKALVVLPSAAPPGLLAAYRTMVAEWARSAPGGLETVLDTELGSSTEDAPGASGKGASAPAPRGLPAGRSVWVLGWENRFVPLVAGALGSYGAALGAGSLRIDANLVARAGHSAVLTARNPKDPDQVLAWVAADSAAAVPGLGRKLPHYHKYSYLAFEGDEPANTIKGRWPVIDSPMTLFPGAADAGSAGSGAGAPARPAMGSLAARPALATLPPAFSGDRMMDTVRFLSADAMRGRGFGSPELDRAAESIAARFREAGLRPGGDPRPEGGANGETEAGGRPPRGGTGPGYFQEFVASGGDPAREATLRNVIGIIPGRKAEWAGQSVVVSAHYDHLGLGWPEARAGNAGRVHPGADDNASGVAVLLELARELGSGWQPDRTVIFVAFAGEEAGRLGSKHYVQAGGPFPAAKCIGAVNLDTVGRLGKGKLLVLGTGSAREWIHIFNGAGYVTGVPIEGAAADPGGSDQKSFLDAGVPAVQLFSGPNLDYHVPTDTADKVDPEGLVKVAMVAREAIDYLASRAEPLTTTLAGATGTAPAGQGTAAAAPGGPPAGPGGPPTAPEGPPTGPGGPPTAPGGPPTGPGGPPTAPGGPPAGPGGPPVPGGAQAGPGGPPGGAGRRVSVGTVPDFGFPGPGLRLSGVVPGSPAEKAGLREGDIITRVGAAPVPDLKAFSDVLKGLKPGDRITIVFTRDGKEQSAEAEVAAR